MAQRRFFSLFSCLLVMLITSSVLADKALPNAPPIDFPPRKAAPQMAELVVKRDARGVTRIVIPAKLAKDADVLLGDAEASSPRRNIVAGLALSAGIIGAFFALRRTSGKTRMVAACLICIVAAGVVSTAVADIALPPELIERKKPQIIVEFNDEAEEVVLIMGKDFPAADGRRANEGREPVDGAAAPE